MWTKKRESQHLHFKHTLSKFYHMYLFLQIRSSKACETHFFTEIFFIFHPFQVIYFSEISISKPDQTFTLPFIINLKKPYTKLKLYKNKKTGSNPTVNDPWPAEGWATIRGASFSNQVHSRRRRAPKRPGKETPPPLGPPRAPFRPQRRPGASGTFREDALVHNLAFRPLCAEACPPAFFYVTIK